MIPQKLEIVRGTTTPLILEVYDPQGLAYIPAEGERLVFGIKKDPERETAPLFTKVAEFLGGGQFLLKLRPEDTADLSCGKYYYDASLDTGDDFFNVIKPSPFYLVANVTHRGCAE